MLTDVEKHTDAYCIIYFDNIILILMLTEVISKKS